MKRMILIVLALALVFDFTSAMAQRRGGGRGGGSSNWYGQAPSSKAELYFLGGYAWTVSQDAVVGNQPGKIDITNAEFWGIAADINVRPEAQLTLLYRRQESDIVFKYSGLTENLSPVALEYYQIGAVSGIQRGNVRPFTSVTLGASRFAFEDYDDSWKFAVIFGLGAKVYLNEKIALRVQGNLPISITDGFVGVGTGGLSLGGTGITQFDLYAGIGILLGSNP
jgi:hypothetical protein